MRLARCGALLGALLSAPWQGSAEERMPLPRYDPFERPPFQAAPEVAQGHHDWTPWLRATLVAGERSMANLGGVLLGLGEETHGYRLVEVNEWRAVFLKDGERIVLDVVPPREAGP